jgi:glycosyltransferase involved in cell wall biosynthesis
VLFSIITPSYRQSNWLKLCVASVADQGGSAEHIVQDAVSDDGTLDWLRQDSRVKAHIEKDAGMYDAVNRGLRRATGEILAYLNCDEQYLPGTLALVEEFFEKHPTVDVLFGDIIMVNEIGAYLSHRKVQVPLKFHTWTCHLSTLSCAMFFRRRIVFDHQEFFDPAWRDAGDAEWMLRLMKRKVRMASLGRFTSTFTQTGANMSAGANAKSENKRLRESAPKWAQTAKPLIVLHHRLRRLMAGSYSQKPFDYSIHTQASSQQRIIQTVDNPNFRLKATD